MNKSYKSLTILRCFIINLLINKNKFIYIMKIISLGGVGGCVLAESLRQLNQQTFPYDWLLATQDFVINSFNDFNKFFIFEEKYVHDKCKLLANDKTAIMLHDFTDFNLQKEEVINKYKRRFERLNNALTSNENILFVRYHDNIKVPLFPFNYYNKILTRNYEDIQKWEEFIHFLKIKYNKNITLLIIASEKEICSKKYNNIILYFIEDRSNSKHISQIINKIINKIINL